MRKLIEAFQENYGMKHPHAVEAVALVRNVVLDQVMQQVWDMTLYHPEEPVIQMLYKTLRRMRTGYVSGTGPQKRIAYVAHPIAGDVFVNLQHLGMVLRSINLLHPTVVPFCPYFADCVVLNDDALIERKRGMQNGQFILRSGIVDELWLTGDRVSAGMAQEADLAKKLGIPVLDYVGVFHGPIISPPKIRNP